MMTQRSFAAVALGLFLGFPGPAKAQFNFTTYRRARIDPDRRQRD